MDHHTSWQTAFSAEVLGRWLTVTAWILVGLSFLSLAFNDSINLTLYLISFLTALAGFVLGLRAFRRGRGPRWVIAPSAVLLLAEVGFIALIIYWLGHTNWD